MSDYDTQYNDVGNGDADPTTPSHGAVTGPGGLNSGGGPHDPEQTVPETPRSYSAPSVSSTEPVETGTGDVLPWVSDKHTHSTSDTPSTDTTTQQLPVYKSQIN